MKFEACEWRPADRDADRSFKIVLMRQKNGPDRYAVYGPQGRLSITGMWDMEPQPSSRTDEFIAIHSYLTLEDAMRAMNRHAITKQEEEK